MQTLRQLDSRLKIHIAFALFFALYAIEVVRLAAQDGRPLLHLGVLGPLLLGLGLALGFSAWLASDTGRSLRDAGALAQRLADGDLRVRPGTAQRGEAGKLMETMAALAARVAATLKEVRAGAEGIATGTGEIATGNMDLSARTEQQAGSLEETASSMEELTATVRQNADHAHEASRLAVSASEVAVKGGQVVADVVGTMASINDSSKQISEIIGVIDGIAFQTNILALNAAVEAARAGEQGRGFAVVAGEVRNLAQRSAAAAKEIKELIGDSVSKVNAGSALVDQAGETMGQIVASVKKVHDIMAEITMAGQRQSEGIEDIGRAIGSMDEMTQQNSALVEEASAAAESLTEQTGQLTGALSVFKLAEQGSGPALGKRAAPLALR